ncbi:hypothetical protein QFZ56_003800 [Streptomyces achromogenes]|uniref:Secreted protein n=1 Tax=Streptomyces achromogenes TaxID=67255 RepID=A0ABU0Q2G3_STRAH|nr:hypothetical protein [Streptomyces achromogenes]MDQ0684837.1 hypothetical protein [Streptomyces achromogenes]
MEIFVTLIAVMATIALGVLIVHLANRQHAIAPPPSAKTAPGATWQRLSTWRRRSTWKSVR